MLHHPASACLWGQYSLGGFEAELLSILEVLFWSLGHTKPLIRLPFFVLDNGSLWVGLDDLGVVVYRLDL